MRLIIDTDAGIDDAEALLLALTYPGAQVEAITTLTGNVHVDKVIANVLIVLQVLGKTVPVYRGAEKPLLSDWFPESDYHGQDGLGDWDERPAVTTQAEVEPAVDALLRLANTYPGELTLVALGPLTNIALAARIDPSFPSKIKRFVFMGGTIEAKGNTPVLTAEWNIFCDPEAAHITLHTFPMATMVSWETTLMNLLPGDQFNALRDRPTPAGLLLKGMHARRGIQAAFGRHGGHLLPDPLAMAVTLDPNLVLDGALHYMTVELGGTETRGQTIIDHDSERGHPANVEVIRRVNIDGVYRLFQQAVG